MNGKMTRWIAAAAVALLVAGCGPSTDDSAHAGKTKAAPTAVPQASEAPASATPASAAPAPDGKVTAREVAAIQARLAKEFPQMHGARITPSVIPGLYEISKGALIGYISADGKYLIEGDLMDIATRHNLTEDARSSWRKQQLAKLDEKNMIIFEPKDVKHTITVFTDVECPYCRRLQSHMADMLDKGIRVRYLFMPVHGPKSVEEAGWVWCAKDRKQAFEAAMNGGDIKQAECKNPVEQQMALGSQLGVRGTPGIIMEDGEMLRGYMPPDALLSRLERGKQNS